MPQTFKHLNPDEIRLAKFVIETDPFKATAYQFDERLGDGMPLDENWEPYIKSMATLLTQRRVDMIAYSAAGDWLIELKERGNAHAIGQLLVYKTLYAQKYPQRTIAGLVLVCPYLGFDLESTFAQVGIMHIIAAGV